MSRYRLATATCPSEKNAIAIVAIAGNESFSGWTKTFTDSRLCAAIVDRLTFGGAIIETGTRTYRLAHAREQKTGTLSASSSFFNCLLLLLTEQPRWRFGD
ncbi:MAG: hypothetical protein QOJ80_4058 [Mycobacterium sp.]|nr:hypothetical protein [Mycobacterium sp.]